MSVSVLAAIASCVAATLSGVGLLTTYLRDERAWRRGALVEVLVEFLEASFQRPGTNSLRKRVAGEDLTVVKARARQAFVSQTSALTRIRLLAPADVAGCAVALFDIENEIQELVLNSSRVPTDMEWNAIYERRRSSRTALLNCSRKHMRLGRITAFEEGRFRPDLDQI